MSNTDLVQCKFCKIPLPSSAWGHHVYGNEHVKNTPAGLLIRGILEKWQIDEAHEYFGQFGTIKTKRVDVIDAKKNLVLLYYDFQHRISHSVIAHQDHTLFGNKMTILWKAKNTTTIKADTNTTQEDDDISENGATTPHIPEVEENDATNDKITTYEVNSSGQFVIAKSDEESRHNSETLEDGEIIYDELENRLQCVNSRGRDSRSRSSSSSYDGRRRRSRSRSRSKSHERRRPKRARRRSRSPRPRKKSFLEEIRDKLNALGSPGMPTANSYSLSGFNVSYPAPPPLIYQLGETEVPQSDPGVSTSTQSSTKQTPQHLNKLLADKKISLSDYLAILGKNVQSQPNKKKNKILSQCKEALRVMNNQHLKKLRLPPPTPPKPQLFTSPLVKNVVKFSFTSPLKSPARSPFADSLLKILDFVGFLKEPHDVQALIDSVAHDLTSGAIINDEIAAKMLQISLLSSECGNNESKKRVASVGTQCIERRNVGVQIKFLPKTLTKTEYVLGSKKRSEENGKKLRQTRKC
ncbi:hypothetical protein Zmor_009392 [Zophobas morio]|uniref:Uncharacterized protein n=1 Tax=Zophobas morio TaxID=2755281 RepID=A0AA38MHY1_9CUCU|nr:hypothetical protein Zmor_009392 [Zophobas morio]